MKLFNTQLFFLGHNDAFSNMYRCDINVGGMVFCTAEHLYVYLKARQFCDINVMNLCLTTPNPYDAKSASRRISGFDHELWDSVKLDFMMCIHLIKFGNGPLNELILASDGIELIEASRDLEWGCGHHIDSITDELSTYPGRNLCGISLMRARLFLLDGGTINPDSILELN